MADVSQTEDEKLAAEWAAMAGDEPATAEADDEADGGGGEFGSTARVLNQNEIDSLLGFADGDAGDRDGSGIRAIIDSALVSYERLPMLEIVFDRLVRMMTTSLRNFTSDNVEVSIDHITSIRFGDYLNSIPLPAMLSVFKAEEWDNYGLLTVDSALIYSIVDVLLGGRRGTAAMRIEGRPYTTIERNLVERMVMVVLQDLSVAFEPLSPVVFRFERLETNPRFATIARPANAAVLARLRLQMFMGEKFGRDSIWEAHLAGELWNTHVQIQAVLDSFELSLKDVMNWKVGTRLALNATPQSNIELMCGDVAMFTGKMGRKGGHIAIRIDEKVEKNKGGIP